MSGTIVRARNWDMGYEQLFVSVSPLGDEVHLYQTNHEDPGIGYNELTKISSRGGFDNIQCSAYSVISPGLTGVGCINGTVHVFDMLTTNSSILKLRPKQNRPCNDISFNNNGWIAVCFDKGRQDSSLQLWNIEHYSRTSDNDHIRRPTYSYLANEAVLSTQFVPELESNVFAGSYKLLREFDMRTDGPLFQIATKCTLGLTFDPFQPFLFSSYSEDGSLAIWDRRKLSLSHVVSESPVLHFNKLLSDSSRKNHNPCVRYSTIRRGEFSSVFNGDLIRRWHTGCVPATSLVPERLSTDKDVLALSQQSQQLYAPKEDLLFVSYVLDVKTDYERVISFDYSPDIGLSTATNFVCMRQSGLVFRMSAVECIDSLDFNSYNEFSLTGPAGAFTNFLGDKSLFDIHIDKQSSTKINYDEFRRGSEYLENHDAELLALVPGDLVDSTRILSTDQCFVTRKRALAGYGVDCQRNVEVPEELGDTHNKLFLRNTWKWVTLAKKSLTKGTMISLGIDLGYQGVYGIWRGVDELKDQNRYKGELTDALLHQAVKAIVSSKGKKAASISIPHNSERKAQRKLALIVSGWYFTDEEFEQRLNLLISLGFVEKAAGWAVFHGDVNRAIEILASSNKEKLNLISTAVAGYLAYKSSNVNSPWKDQCRKMALELSDPYLRAIFAFIADNDWWDVLDEHSLPLRERLGIALRFLSDKDLTVYLGRLADHVVAKGELEGLILTGLTPRGIDLLQLYVDRTLDVQTAALLTTYAVPRYFHDHRASHWIDCYRTLLNSWGLFSIRAKFDVARTKLLKTATGSLSIQPAPKQVYLQCGRCNKNLLFTKENHMVKHFSKLQVDRDISACPHCGAPLPRCAVCLLTLGTPIPSDSPSENTRDVIESSFRDKFSFCLSCNHGAHAFHAEEWFSKHYVCPVPDCNCRCNSK